MPESPKTRGGVGEINIISRILYSTVISPTLAQRAISPHPCERCVPPLPGAKAGRYELSWRAAVWAAHNNVGQIALDETC